MAGEHPEKHVPMKSFFAPKQNPVACLFCPDPKTDVYVFDVRPVKGRLTKVDVTYVCPGCNNGNIPTREKTP